MAVVTKESLHHACGGEPLLDVLKHAGLAGGALSGVVAGAAAEPGCAAAGQCLGAAVDSDLTVGALGDGRHVQGVPPDTAGEAHVRCPVDLIASTSRMRRSGSANCAGGD